LAERRTGLSEAAEPGIAIDQAGVAAAKAHFLIGGLARADADQGLADEAASPDARSGPRSARDGDDDRREIIPGLEASGWHGRWRVGCGRSPLAERFVEPLEVVVAVSELSSDRCHGAGWLVMCARQRRASSSG
jgi:hypothetical protein